MGDADLPRTRCWSLPQEEQSLMEVGRIHRWQDQVNSGLATLVPAGDLVLLFLSCYLFHWFQPGFSEIRFNM